MGITQFSDISSFSSQEISKTIVEVEDKLFNLRFKKATRQNFKSHELKSTKCRLAHLKTLLTKKLKDFKTIEYI